MKATCSALVLVSSIALSSLYACGGQAGDAKRDERDEEVAPSGSASSPVPVEEEPTYSASGGAPADRPRLGAGNIGGAQFTVATSCDACGWQREDERCVDLISVMPYIDDNEYYPCLRPSQAFANCIREANDLCGRPSPAICPRELAAVDECRAAPPSN